MDNDVSVRWIYYEFENDHDFIDEYSTIKRYMMPEVGYRLGSHRGLEYKEYIVKKIIWPTTRCADVRVEAVRVLS